MNKIILHIDMNSYFASVEQQANPFLRGKPVGVCAYLSPNGCIIASSLEAKKFGVKTGMRAREAKAICPDIILLENEPAKYRSVTEKIFGILEDYSDHIEHYSIDEAFVDLTGYFPHHPNPPPPRGRESGDNPLSPLQERDMERGMQYAYTIALTIKHRIQTEVGDYLKCSIGISYTRWLAKFASDVAEKNSILILTPENLESTYARVALTDAWGIKERMAQRLNQLGIFTLNDLKHYSVSNLMQALGKPGYYLWAHVNGIEIEGVKNTEEIAPKSFGHQYTLAKKTTDLNYLRGILMKLCEKTGRRLRVHHMEAKSISAVLSFVDGGGIYKTLKTSEPLFTTASIYQKAEKILFSSPLPDRARLLAVSVGSLVPMTNQLSLLENIIKSPFASSLVSAFAKASADKKAVKERKTSGDRQKKLAQAMDKINNTYGEFTITSGEMWGMEKFAKDRIGFRKIEI